MFQEEKELHTAAYIGADHSELQAAYSIDTVNGVLLNSYMGYTGNVKDTGYHKSFMLEAGYVYSKKLNHRYKVELIGGYGYGRKKYFEHYVRDCWISLFDYPSHREVWYDFENSFHRLFGQINWGVAIGKAKQSKSAFAFTLRTTAMFYTKYSFFYEKYNLNLSYINPIEKDYAELRNKMVVLVDPGFTLRFSLFGARPVYLTYIFNIPAFAFGHRFIRKYTPSWTYPFIDLGLIYTGFGLEIAFSNKKEKDVIISK